MSAIPRFQAIVLPILRAAPALSGVKVGSWIEDIDYRDFPMINIRRAGGTRHDTRPKQLDRAIMEMTAYGAVGLIETEQLYIDALEALYDAVDDQTMTPDGYLHSIKETFGMTQFSSLFMDSWRVQGLIQLGLRPPRGTYSYTPRPPTVYPPETPVYVSITTTGSTFSPILGLASGSDPDISWTVDGEEVGVGATPTIDFGSSATRVVLLSVTDAGANALDQVETFNVGFDHTQDAGTYNLGSGYDHTAQAVTAVSGVNAMTGLKNFLAACPNLAGTIDFSGMSELEYIELYQANVTGVTLTGCSSLIRLCLEQNALTTLDLNPVAATLRDLRAADQNTASLTFTTLTSNLAVLYHFCVRDQTVIGHPPLSRMPLLTQLWNWNTGQSGALALGGHAHIQEVRSYNNAYTSVTGISGATALSYIDLTGNSLDVTDVNQILSDLDALATSGSRTVILTGLGAPTGAGATAATALEGRGWTVTADSSVTTLFTETFTRANAANLAAVGNGWVDTFANGFAGNITSNVFNKTSTGSYQTMTNTGGQTLPADYSVEVTFPHANLSTSFNFVIARWDGADGVRVEIVSSGSFNIGNANGFNAGDVARTADNAIPASWSVNQDHTVKVECIGTLINVYYDGVLVGHRSGVTWGNTTGTSFGVGGGSAETYKQVTVTA